LLHVASSLLAHARSNVAGVTWRDFFNIRAFGFALIRGWGFLMIFGGITTQTAVIGYGALLQATVLLTPILTFVIGALCCTTLDRLFEATPFKLLVLLLCPVGIFMRVLGASLVNPFLVLLGTVFNSVGSTLILLAYGFAFSFRKPAQLVVEVPFAIVQAALVLLIAIALPSNLLVLTAAFLPVISGIILFSNSFPWSPAQRKGQVFPLHIGPFARRFGVCVMLAGISDGLIRAVFLSNPTAPLEGYWMLNPCLWSCVLMAVIIYLSTFFSSDTSLRFTYRSIAFIMAAIFMLLPVLTQIPLLSDIMALTAYQTFAAFVWILLATISYNLRLSATMVFGLGLGFVYGGHLLGAVASELIKHFEPLSTQDVALIVFIAVLCILLSYMFIFSENSLSKLVRYEDNVGRRPFSELCDGIASHYGLTPRETEIMMLFAKGHTITRIQEELFISRGTAATHLRHLYQKLAVHDKQEFLALIEDYRRQL